MTTKLKAWAISYNNEVILWVKAKDESDARRIIGKLVKVSRASDDAPCRDENGKWVLR
ncbi:MAG: hypothetical protein QXS81_05010 [Candidatus Micrarchaeaceae archaeon]